jgi:hypothetical protein
MEVDRFGAQLLGPRDRAVKDQSAIIVAADISPVGTHGDLHMVSEPYCNSQIYE